MEIGFQFEVIYRDDDLIEVRVSAWNGAFGGSANVYLGIGRLREMAEQLRGFPSSIVDSREAILGAFGPEFAGGGVSIRFFCIDRSGHAYVDAEIESGDSSAGVFQTVNLVLPVEAAALDLFVEDLRRLDTRSAVTAFLRGGAVVS